MAGYGYMNRGYTDDRNKKTYGETGYFDPASRPTIFEAEGRKRPTISYSPNPFSESYITTSTERIVEYGRPPLEPVKDYGYTDDKWRRPSSPIRDHPQRVEEFISNVQVEPNRGATRPGFLGITNWHNQPYSGDGTGYGEYDNYHRDDSFTEPAMINQDGGKDRCLAGNMSKHPSHGPTNDIGQAVEILKEEAKTSPVSVATALVSTVPKRDTYTTNPESRYFSLTTMPGNFSLSTMPGNFNLSSRPC